ncbi:PAS/PAC sensor hybrid histidine kinase [Gloeothece citriformis PCC 7424]|uniref:histidine kinase n=1 Tax=Gloeothece citriformis (strain PCC 7424) TaxID=65393 RepID=B7KD81_GLOC7|nr:PAS domain-containing sensor histidine kinase [Gloeothece citriformis]ACK68901.1 PAS/PAC sensor hybrid histidine kinase [Gloeothece citriformis PCC 7424]
MDIKNFEQQIQKAHYRWQNLQKSAEESSEPSTHWQTEIITELSIALEELRVATEELHEQNEQLDIAREEAEEVRQHYQDLFEFAPDGYIVTDEKGVIQEANEVASQLLNVQKKYLFNKPIDIFVARIDQDIFNNHWSKIQKTLNNLGNYQPQKFIKSWEMILQPRHQDPFPVAVSVSVSVNIKGEIIKLRWLLRDLTQQKKTQEQLSEQAALLNVVSDAIIVYNLHDQIVFWNRSAQDLYGWTAQEIEGKNISLILSADSQQKLAQIYQSLFKQGEWKGELNQIKRTGKSIIVDSRWTVVRDEKKNLKSILVVNTDITLAKQLETERLQSQRLEIIGSLASGISHDLNNILTPILGMAQLLPRKLPHADEQIQQMFKIIEINAQRGASLLRQILTFSRGFTPKQDPILVDSLLSDITHLAQETFPKSITIDNFIPPNLWAIRGDTTQIHQVLMNLCLNGRDAMPDGGNLTLTAQNMVIDECYTSMETNAQPGLYVVITVSDTGVGIPEPIKKRIFEPFFSSKELGKGTGLGLSIVMNIVKNHGGFIKVLSEPGKGSQFQVFLPAVNISLSSAKKNIDLPKGNGALILVVDDEANINQTTKHLLNTFGYQVLTANNGIEALALYAQYHDKIEAILMDMIMPSMDGITAIRTLQKINPQVKIIATSGLSSIEESADIFDDNVKAFLHKPYTSQDLLTTLYKVLSN